MPTRIVSFLGLGNTKKLDPYEIGQHHLDGEDQGPPSQLKDVALLAHAQRSGKSVQLVILGTQKVRERWITADGLLLRTLTEAGFGDIPVTFGEVPSEDPTGTRFFDLCRQALDPRCQIAGGIFESLNGPQPQAIPPDKIFLDITHGFRSQPFACSAALAYVESDLRRAARQGEPVPEVDFQVFYANWERRDQNSSPPRVPIERHTTVIELLQWNDALGDLMNHGRGDALELRASALQKRLNAHAEGKGRDEFVRLGAIKTLAVAAKNLADGLSTARIPLLLTELAPRLARSIPPAREVLAEHQPMLAGQLDRLEAWVTPMTADEPVSAEGIRASLHLAKLYQRLERFSELSALLRETAVSLAAVTWEQPCQPGDPEFKAARQVVEDRLNAGRENPEQPLLVLFKNLGELRNDVQHCGFRTGASAPNRVLLQLGELLGRLEAIADDLLPSPPK